MSYNNNMSSESEDKELKTVGLELMFLTPDKYSNTDGITAVELAKRVNLSVTSKLWIISFFNHQDIFQLIVNQNHVLQKDLSLQIVVVIFF